MIKSKTNSFDLAGPKNGKTFKDFFYFFLVTPLTD